MRRVSAWRVRCRQAAVRIAFEDQQSGDAAGKQAVGTASCIQGWVACRRLTGVVVEGGTERFVRHGFRVCSSRTAVVGP